MTDNYLYDYITFGATYTLCDSSYDSLFDITDKSGFEKQPSKCFRPAQQMEALGLITDTVGKQIKVLDDKLIAILSELHAWSNSSICTKRQLLSLIGKLSFISQAVRAGRTFLRCLIGLSRKARFLHFKLKINKQARSDINWWIRCLRPHSGISMFPKPSVPENTFYIFTDASNVGGAGVLNNDWFCIHIVGDKRCCVR